MLKCMKKDEICKKLNINIETFKRHCAKHKIKYSDYNKSTNIN